MGTGTIQISGIVEWSRSNLYLQDKERLDLHIFMDQSSVEVFADEYRNVHTCRLY